MRKSQESAPIELVIAVIIMVMSITIAFTVWGNIQTTQCTNQIQSNMMTLENAVVDVSLGSPPTQRAVYLNFPSCGSYNIQAIRFSYYPNPLYCGKCVAASNGCWMIEPLSFNSQTQAFSVVTDASICLNTPASIDFLNDPSPNCNYHQNINPSGSCPPTPLLPSGFNTISNCNAPPPSNGFVYATIGKGSLSLYKLILSKNYVPGTAPSTVEINMCLESPSS